MLHIQYLTVYLTFTQSKAGTRTMTVGCFFVPIFPEIKPRIKPRTPSGFSPQSHILFRNHSQDATVPSSCVSSSMLYVVLSSC